VTGLQLQARSLAKVAGNRESKRICSLAPPRARKHHRATATAKPRTMALQGLAEREPQSPQDQPLPEAAVPSRVFPQT